MSEYSHKCPVCGRPVTFLLEEDGKIMCKNCLREWRELQDARLKWTSLAILLSLGALIYYFLVK